LPCLNSQIINSVYPGNAYSEIEHICASQPDNSQIPVICSFNQGAGSSNTVAGRLLHLDVIRTPRQSQGTFSVSSMKEKSVGRGVNQGRW